MFSAMSMPRSIVQRFRADTVNNAPTTLRDGAYENEKAGQCARPPFCSVSV